MVKNRYDLWLPKINMMDKKFIPIRGSTGAKAQKVLRAIKEYGKEGIYASQLARRLRWNFQKTFAYLKSLKKDYLGYKFVGRNKNYFIDPEKIKKRFG